MRFTIVREGTVISERPSLRTTLRTTSYPLLGRAEALAERPGLAGIRPITNDRKYAQKMRSARRSWPLRSDRSGRQGDVRMCKQYGR